MRWWWQRALSDRAGLTTHTSTQRNTQTCSHQLPQTHARAVACPGETEGQSGNPGSPSEDMARWVVGRTEEEARAQAATKFPGRAVAKLVQDEDVLDTW